jgi:toxin ParE1/3/4
MAHTVVWSLASLEDVESIAIYISRDSISYAAAVVKQILDSTRNLTDFPLSGRVVPELENQNIREVFAYSYRIVYLVGDQTITIIAVIHGKRLLGSVLPS